MDRNRQTGIFSAKVVSSFEFIASVLLIAGAAMSRQRTVQVLGLLSVNAPMTPNKTHLAQLSKRGLAARFVRGVTTANRWRALHAGLWPVACGVWAACAVLRVLCREIWRGWLAPLRGF